MLIEIFNSNDTYNADAYKDDNKQPAQHCVDLDITVPHCWHGNHKEIQTLPVRDGTGIDEAEEYISRVL